MESADWWQHLFCLPTTTTWFTPINLIPMNNQHVSPVTITWLTCRIKSCILWEKLPATRRNCNLWKRNIIAKTANSINRFPFVSPRNFLQQSKWNLSSPRNMHNRKEVTDREGRRKAKKNELVKIHFAFFRHFYLQENMLTWTKKLLSWAFPTNIPCTVCEASYFHCTIKHTYTHE